MAAQEQRDGVRVDLLRYLRSAFFNRVTDLRRTSRYRVKQRETESSPEDRQSGINLLNCGTALFGTERELALSNAMSEALSNLSEREREIVSASVAGYDTKHLAKMYAISEGNVYVVLCRFRKSLEATLRQHL